MSAVAGRELAVTGVAALVVAVGATVATAAVATAAGIDLEVAGEAIPLAGIAFVTGVLSAVGVVVAAACRRWSDEPAARFVQVTVALTAASLVAPALADARVPVTLTLAVLHLVPAAVMIPALARCLSGVARQAVGLAS